MTESKNNIEIVDSLRSLYPLQDFEETAVMEVVEELNAYRANGTVEEFAYAKRKVHIAELATEYIASQMKGEKECTKVL